MKHLSHICLFCLCFTLACQAQPAKRTLAVGDSIPGFSLYNQDGKLFHVKEYLGKTVLVIYFYPKDESLVCTKEACSFRDDFEAFKQAGATVIGINSGTVESHKRFQQHHQLPFALLSDPDHQVLKRFGVKNAFLMSGRETFVVDLEGKIVFVYNSMMQGKAHAAETLKFIKAMKHA